MGRCTHAHIHPLFASLKSKSKQSDNKKIKQMNISKSFSFFIQGSSKVARCTSFEATLHRVRAFKSFAISAICHLSFHSLHSCTMNSYSSWYLNVFRCPRLRGSMSGRGCSATAGAATPTFPPTARAQAGPLTAGFLTLLYGNLKCTIVAPYSHLFCGPCGEAILQQGACLACGVGSILHFAHTSITWNMRKCEDIWHPVSLIGVP